MEQLDSASTFLYATLFALCQSGSVDVGASLEAAEPHSASARSLLEALNAAKRFRAPELPALREALLQLVDEWRDDRTPFDMSTPADLVRFLGGAFGDMVLARHLVVESGLAGCVSLGWAAAACDAFPSGVELRRHPPALVFYVSRQAATSYIFPDPYLETEMGTFSLKSVIVVDRGRATVLARLAASGPYSSVLVHLTPSNDSDDLTMTVEESFLFDTVLHPIFGDGRQMELLNSLTMLEGFKRFLQANANWNEVGKLLTNAAAYVYCQSDGRMPPVVPTAADADTDAAAESFLQHILQYQFPAWNTAYESWCRNRVVFSDDEADIAETQPTCPICQTEVESLVSLPGCQHEDAYCRICLQEHIHVKIEEGLLSVRCPAERCSVELEFDMLQHFGRPEDVNALNDRLSKQSVSRDESVIECSGCHMPLAVFDGAANNVVTCPYSACRTKTCYSCRAKWHTGLTCADYQQSVAAGRAEHAESEQRSTEYIRKETRRCPRCGVGPCEKQSTEQCDVATCPQCRPTFKFCWQCGVDYARIKAADCSVHLPSCRWHTKS